MAVQPDYFRIEERVSRAGHYIDWPEMYACRDHAFDRAIAALQEGLDVRVVQRNPNTWTPDGVLVRIFYISVEEVG